MKTRMKPLVMWALVEKETGKLVDAQHFYTTVKALYAKREWAEGVCGRQSRVAKVEIREVRSR
jgi:hypothetical protein